MTIPDDRINEITDKIIAVAQSTLGDFVVLKGVKELKKGKKYQEYSINIEPNIPFPKRCIYNWDRDKHIRDSFGGLIVTTETGIDVIRRGVDLYLPRSYVLLTAHHKNNIYEYPAEILQKIFKSEFLVIT